MLFEQVGVGNTDGLAERGEEGCLEFFGSLWRGLGVFFGVHEDLELEVPAEVVDIVDVDAHGVPEVEFANFRNGEPDGEWGLAEAFEDLVVGVDGVVGDFGGDLVGSLVVDVFDGFGRADAPLDGDGFSFFESASGDVVVGVRLTDLGDLGGTDPFAEQPSEIRVAEFGFPFEVLHGGPIGGLGGYWLIESRVCWSLASSQTSIPSDSALESLEPALSPAMRRSVDLETEPVTLAPRDSSFSVRSVRVNCWSVPVRTMVFPENGESMEVDGSR